jgi:ATP-dependent RNA helicase DDX31/DBP7
LAKAFALRDAPSNMAQKKAHQNDSKTRLRRTGKFSGSAPVDLESSDESDGVKTAEKRMKAVVRSQGRLSRKSGVMMSTGASEFQIASNDILNSLRK